MATLTTESVLIADAAESFEFRMSVQQPTGDVHFTSPTIGVAVSGVLGQPSASQFPKVAVSDLAAWKAGVAAFVSEVKADIVAHEAAHGPITAAGPFPVGKSAQLVDDPAVAVGDGQTIVFAEPHSPDGGTTLVPGRIIISTGGNDALACTVDGADLIEAGFTALGVP